MVNDSNPVPPAGSSNTPVDPSVEEAIDKIPSMTFTHTSVNWGEMTFTAKEWNVFMTSIYNSFVHSMDNVFKKQKEAMRKTFQISQGEDPDS